MERSLLMLYAFAFLLVSSKRKAFTDIHRNNGLIRLIMIQQRSSNCNKPVITWPTGASYIYDHTRAQSA